MLNVLFREVPIGQLPMIRFQQIANNVENDLLVRMLGGHVCPYSRGFLVPALRVGAIECLQQAAVVRSQALHHHSPSHCLARWATTRSLEKRAA